MSPESELSKSGVATVSISGRTEPGVKTVCVKCNLWDDRWKVGWVGGWAEGGWLVGWLDSRQIGRQRNGWGMFSRLFGWRVCVHTFGR